MNDYAAICILRNPWHWDDRALERARNQCVNRCPRGYDECQEGCVYPGRCYAQAASQPSNPET